MGGRSSIRRFRCRMKDGATMYINMYYRKYAISICVSIHTFWFSILIELNQCGQLENIKYWQEGQRKQDLIYSGILGKWRAEEHLGEITKRRKNKLINASKYWIL